MIILIYSRRSTALSFKIVLHLGKCYYFIADIRTFIVLRFYDFPLSDLISEGMLIF